MRRTLALLLCWLGMTAAACGGGAEPTDAGDRPDTGEDLGMDSGSRDDTGVTPNDAGDPGGADAFGLDAFGADVFALGDAGSDSYPTFERDVVPILNRSCGSATAGCHGRAAYEPSAASSCRGWLSLVDAPIGGSGCAPRDLYTRLIDLDAWGCESMDPRVRYVTPCDTSRSYLFRKIGGGPYCRNADGTTSQPMPMGSTLPATDIELIREWIMAGAPRDGEARTDCTMIPVGNAPVVEIWHPSDGEMRQAGRAIPFTTNAMDVEDGDIAASVVVTSDVEGEIGRGRTFSWTPTTLGAQVITASVTDSDSRTDTGTITLNIIR